jgi:hypothetical protein
MGQFNLQFFQVFFIFRIFHWLDKYLLKRNFKIKDFGRLNHSHQKKAGEAAPIFDSYQILARYLGMPLWLKFIWQRTNYFSEYTLSSDIGF